MIHCEMYVYMNANFELREEKSGKSRKAGE